MNFKSIGRWEETNTYAACWADGNLVLNILFVLFFWFLFTVGQRIWIDFVDYNLDEQQTMKLYLSRSPDEYAIPFKHRNSVNDGAFLSDGESVKIEYSTNRMPRGRGFKIAYKLGKSYQFVNKCNKCAYVN